MLAAQHFLSFFYGKEVWEQKASEREKITHTLRFESENPRLWYLLLHPLHPYTHFSTPHHYHPSCHTHLSFSLCLGNSSSTFSVFCVWRMAFRYIFSLSLTHSRHPRQKAQKKKKMWINFSTHSSRSANPNCFLTHFLTLTPSLTLTQYRPPTTPHSRSLFIIFLCSVLYLVFSFIRSLLSHFLTYFNSDNIFSIFHHCLFVASTVAVVSSLVSY